MYWLGEVFVVISIISFFIKREKPKIRFLFYGIFFYFIALILKIPILFIYPYFKYFFNGNIVPYLFFTVFAIMISEITKYFSLKRFLKTKSYKNGILFGLGWAGFDSVNYFKILFFGLLSGIFFFNLDYSFLITRDMVFFNFLLFFLLNLASTVLVVISVIKRNLWYVSYAIIFMMLPHFGSILFDSNYYVLIFDIFLIIYSLFIIFHYRKIK